MVLLKFNGLFEKLKDSFLSDLMSRLIYIHTFGIFRQHCCPDTQMNKERHAVFCSYSTSSASVCRLILSNPEKWWKLTYLDAMCGSVFKMFVFVCFFLVRITYMLKRCYKTRRLTILAASISFVCTIAERTDTYTYTYTYAQ